MNRLVAKVSTWMPAGATRATVSAPARAAGARAATAQDVGLAIRFMVVLFGVGSMFAVKLAITSQMQQTAVALDHARSEVQRSEIRRERLLMERAMLRQPGRLQAAAAQLGLEAPVAVVDVPPVTP